MKDRWGLIMLEDAVRNDFLERVGDYALVLPGSGTIPYGVGCAWLGRRELDRERLGEEVDVLEYAFRKGFKYYDTSAAYGESEVVVGQFISRICRPDVFLATKSRIPEHLSPSMAAEHVRASLEASLNRLQTDYVDLFQVHDVSSLHQVLADDGVLSVLKEAKEEGRIRNIGLATRDLELLKTAVVDGGFDTVLTYSDYTPIDVRASELIHFARAHRVGVINGSPLSAGLLTGSAVGEWEAHGIPELMLRKERALRLHDLCSRMGESVLHFALHFPLRNDGINMTLTGPASVEDLRSTLSVLQIGVSDTLWAEYTAWARTYL